MIIIIIRHEQPKDYSKIAAVNYEAFHNWKKENPLVIEPLLVDVARHNSLFDPELSVVAENDGEIVGHVLYSPFTFYFNGHSVKGAVLGPIAVKPSWQKQGVGGKLIEAGHKLLEEKGYELSLLCGHPEYYPKFGYQTSTFGFTSTKLSINSDMVLTDGIVERPVELQDIPWIINTWSLVHDEDEIAIHPGSELMDWVNHGVDYFTSMLIKNGEPFAYVRYKVSEGLEIKELLSDEDDIITAISYLMSKNKELDIDYLIIGRNVEDIKVACRSMDNIIIENVSPVYDAFMIYPVGNKGCVHDYCESIKEDMTKIGGIIFPPFYDIEG